MNSLQTSKKINLYLLVIEPVLVESINASTLSVSIELKTLYFPVGFHAWKKWKKQFWFKTSSLWWSTDSLFVVLSFWYDWDTPGYPVTRSGKINRFITNIEHHASYVLTFLFK